jgi:hypothetical protein
MIHGSGEREAARVEALPGLQERLSGAEIEAARANEAAPRRACENRDGLALDARVLLDDDRVGAARQRRAGEDAHRFSPPDAAREAAPGDARADDAQRRWRARHVLRAHRVSVHGGGGERRLRAQGGEIARQGALVTGVQRHGLGGDRLAHAGEHPAKRFLDGKQAHASAASKLPERPPLLATTRMPSTRMARSTAFTMS